MGWKYKGAPLKRGQGSYPLARRFIIEKLLPSFKEKLVYEDDPNLPSDEDNILLNRFEHILNTESPQKITGEYEIQFMRNFHHYLEAIFGSNYWDKLIREQCKDQWDKGEGIKTAKEKSIKKLAKKLGIEGSELTKQLEKGSYDQNVYWLDWPQIKEILENFFKDDQGIIKHM